MTLFGNTSIWGGGPSKACPPGKRFDWQLIVEPDARTATLTVNEKTFELEFTESVTSISYNGFGVHNADTLFSVQVIE